MFRLMMVFAVLASATPALADEDRCTALYERLRAEAPGDTSRCTPVLEEPKTEQCTLPSNHSSERLPSHVVMILDASGSMAGRVGGEQKMAVAKREAGQFLTDLAKDVPVGLMVYGHRGTNKESGKSESCAAMEWAHPVGAGRHELKASIDKLAPTGWTPMGDVLKFAQAELEKLSINKGDKDSTPVVYLISDGEETCDGDPVTAAKALHESGVKALVHVIGFDVDKETRAQLEAISEAGGGKYFAAKDSAALRKHLKAAADTVNSHARFEYCLHLNQGYAETIYNSASNSVPACFGRESETKTLKVILKQIKAFTSEADMACAKKVERLARAANSQNTQVMLKLYRELLDGQTVAGLAARKRATAEALPAK